VLVILESVGGCGDRERERGVGTESPGYDTSSVFSAWDNIPDISTSAIRTPSSCWHAQCPGGISLTYVNSLIESNGRASAATLGSAG